MYLVLFASSTISLYSIVVMSASPAAKSVQAARQTTLCMLACRRKHMTINTLVILLLHSHATDTLSIHRSAE